MTGCEQVFVVKNVSTTQNIEAADCLASASGAPPIYADAYDILLRAGQSLTVTMTSSAVDSFIDIFRSTQNGLVLVASNDNKDGTTKDALLTFTASTSAYYVIAARTAVSAQTAGYTLTIQ